MSTHDTRDTNDRRGDSQGKLSRETSDQGSIAYELLLLQQRLDAYERLHLEEMAELRKEIERLRRAFLQETSPQMHIITSGHKEV